MVQVLEKQEIEYKLILIPAKEEKKVEKKAEKKQLKLEKPAKYHQELICIQKLKNKLDAQMYRRKIIAF